MEWVRWRWLRRSACMRAASTTCPQAKRGEHELEEHAHAGFGPITGGVIRSGPPSSEVSTSELTVKLFSNVLMTN